MSLTCHTGFSKPKRIWYKRGARARLQLLIGAKHYLYCHHAFMNAHRKYKKYIVENNIFSLSLSLSFRLIYSSSEKSFPIFILSGARDAAAIGEAAAVVYIGSSCIYESDVMASHSCVKNTSHTHFTYIYRLAKSRNSTTSIARRDSYFF